MDYPLDTITVDWNLIKIWCCGKFLSSADVPAHTELCHAQAASSKEENRSRSGPSRRTRQFRTGSSEFSQKLRKPTKLSAQEGGIGSPGTENSSKKRKENEKVTNEASDETNNNLEKLHSGFIKRKSKMDSENDFSSAKRADLTSSSVNTSDLKDTFIDTNGIEGDSEAKMETISDNMPNMKSDEDGYLGQKELDEQKIAVDRSNSSSVKNVKVMILHAHGVIKKLEEKKRENRDQRRPKNEETESDLISSQSISENSQESSLIQESTLFSPRTINNSIQIPTPEPIFDSHQLSTPRTIMASTQSSTPQPISGSNQLSTPRTIIPSNQCSTPRTILDSNQLSTPQTILDSNQLSTPRTIIASNPCSTPRIITDSTQLSTPRTIMASNQRSISTPQIMDTVIVEDKNAQMPTNKVSQCKNIVNKNNVERQSNRKEVPNHRKSKVKTLVKTNSSDKWKSKGPVYCQQKRKIKKEKSSETEEDFSPIGGDENDSDNEAVNTDMDFSCKVRNCLANFWFKSQLDQHTLDVH